MPRASTHPPHLRPVAPAAGSAQTPLTELLRRAKAGDVDAWSTLYETHYQAVYAHLRYQVGDPAVAEELAQETFAQGMASAARYDERRPMVGWLLGIARNLVHKHWRKGRNRQSAHRRLEVLTELRAGGVGDPGLRHLRSERSRAVYAALEEMPARWREAFVLRELRGMGSTEAAKMLGISPSNLSARVSRARTRLREELVRQGWLQENPHE